MSIDERVARLERENRRLRAAFTALAGGFVLVLLMGQAPAQKKDEPPPIVKARSVRIVDGKGATRATLGASPDGAPFLTFTDETSRVRASLFVSDDGRPALALNDREEKTRAMLGLERSDAGFLAFSDKDGKQTWNAP